MEEKRIELFLVAWHPTYKLFFGCDSFQDHGATVQVPFGTNNIFEAAKIPYKRTDMIKKAEEYFPDLLRNRVIGCQMIIVEKETVIRLEMPT